MFRKRIFVVSGITTVFTAGMLAASLLLGSASAAGAATSLPPVAATPVQQQRVASAPVTEHTAEGAGDGETIGSPEGDAPGGAAIQQGGQWTSRR